MSSRQKYNKLILGQISAQIEAYPDLRFHQILHNIGVTELDRDVQYGDAPHEVEYLSSDKFSEESKKTYERVLNSQQ